MRYCGTRTLPRRFKRILTATFVVSPRNSCVVKDRRPAWGHQVGSFEGPCTLRMRGAGRAGLSPELCQTEAVVSESEGPGNTGSVSFARLPALRRAATAADGAGGRAPGGSWLAVGLMVAGVAVGVTILVLTIKGFTETDATVAGGRPAARRVRGRRTRSAWSGSTPPGRRDCTIVDAETGDEVELHRHTRRVVRARASGGQDWVGDRTFDPGSGDLEVTCEEAGGPIQIGPAPEFEEFFGGLAIGILVPLVLGGDRVPAADRRRDPVRDRHAPRTQRPQTTTRPRSTTRSGSAARRGRRAGRGRRPRSRRARPRRGRRSSRATPGPATRRRRGRTPRADPGSAIATTSPAMLPCRLIPPPSEPAYSATPASYAAMIVSRRRACRSVMWAAYAGNLVAGRLGVLRELVDLHHRRHQRDPLLDHRVDQVLGQAGAVLDAVDAGLDQARQHRLAEAVRGHPRAVLVRGRDRRGERLGRERRRQVALVAGDPVADQLDPAVAALRLLGDVRRSARPARSRGRSCGCSAWCGRCAGPPGSAAAGPRGRGSRRCRRPSRSRGSAARPRRGRRSPAASVSSSEIAPSSSSPRWQWASTRPGTIHPSASVSAPTVRS